MSLYWFKRSLAVVLLVLAASACLASQTVTLDRFEYSSQWYFSNGGEFPGANGSIACKSDGRLSLNYDFTKGGEYVAAGYSGSTPPEMQEFRVNIWSTNDCRICYRILDANGRTFQGDYRDLKANTKVALTLPVSGHWINAWDGTPTPQPVLPVRQLCIMACNTSEYPKTGAIFLGNLEGVSASATKLYSSQERRATPLTADKTSRLMQKMAKSLYYPEAKVGEISATVGYNGPDETVDDVRDLRVYCKDKLILGYWGRIGLTGKTEYYNPMNIKVQSAKVNGRDVWQWGNTDSRTGFAHMCRTSIDAKGITSTVYFRFLKAHDGKVVLSYCPPEGTVKYFGGTGAEGDEYGLIFPEANASKAEYDLGDRKLSCLFSVAKPAGMTLHDGETRWSHVMGGFHKFSYIEIAPPNGKAFPAGYENAVQLRSAWDASAKHPASIEACTWDDGVNLSIMEKDGGKWVLPQTPEPRYFFAGDKKEIAVMLHNLSDKFGRSVVLSCRVRDNRDRDTFTKTLRVSLAPSEMRQVVIPLAVKEKGIYTVILSADNAQKVSRFAVLPKPATVAAKDSFFGVDPVFYPGTEKDMDMLRAFGIRMLRLGGGVWHPGSVEDAKAYLRSLAKHDIDYFLLIAGRDDVTSEYKELGKSWEIINEPNNGTWRPDQYAEEVRVTVEKIKAVNPSAMVLGCDVSGGDSDSDFAFTRRFLVCGGGKYIDVIPFHPYSSIRLFGDGLNPMSPDDNQLLPKMLRAQELTRANNLRMWIGEVGYMHQGILDFPGAKVDANERVMANYLVRLYLLARCVPDMEKVVWFELSKDASTQDFHPAEKLSYSLLGAENNVTPQIVAYANLASLIDGAKFERKLNFPIESLYGVLHSRGDKQILALWSARDPYSLTFDSKKALDVTSIVGAESKVNPVNGKITLTLTGEPFYITSDDAGLTERIERAEIIVKEPVEIADIAIVGTNLSAVLRNKTAKPLTAKVELGDESWSVKLAASEQKDFLFPVKHAGQTIKVIVEAGGSRIAKTRSVSKETVKPDMVALRAEKPITIDGDLVDWQGASPIVLDKHELVSPPDPGFWKGPEDLSATGYIKYDDQYLYFACAVKDDMQTNDEPAGTIWAKDSIQLGLGNMEYPDAYTEISFGLSSSAGVVHFMNMGANQGVPVEGMKLAIKRNPGETIYEAAIPFTALKGAFIYPGCNIRLAFIVNDADDFGRKWIATKDPSLIGGTKDTKGFPVLYFKP